MATRIGTGVTGSADSAASSIAAAAKDTTGAHLLVCAVKWEASGPTLSSVTDSQGNSWTIASQLAHSTGGEPHGAVAYCIAPTNNASLVVTANFSASTPTFRRIQVEAFSSALGAFAFDLTYTAAQGTTGPYLLGAQTTTAAGVVFAGIADFSTLTSPSAAGTPTFSLGATNTDSFCIYLLSGSGQSVTPSATVISGITRWVMTGMAVKEVAAAGSGKLSLIFPLARDERGESDTGTESGTQFSLQRFGLLSRW